MESNDSSSKKIIDNISILSEYDLKFIYSKCAFNYVFSEDDLSKIEYAISTTASTFVACHEFGHLLLDIFARGELPEDYERVNKLCTKRLLAKKELVSSLLQRYRDNAFASLMSEIEEPLSYYERHKDFAEEYLRENPEADESEMIQDAIIEHFALISSFDKKIDSYNRIGNIIDGMFHGNNPFYLDYGNDQFHPVLSMHDCEYFTEDDNGPIVAGFEEQFADYLVLRIYRDEMKQTINVLQSLIGSEWFDMMDKHYDKISDRISTDSKVYQYK